MACNETPANILPIKPSKNEDDSLDVISRYKKLMVASTGDDSLYEISKKSIWELSKELNMTEEERMKIVSTQITEMTKALSTSAMSVALGWAKEDAGVGYSTAILKATAEKTTTEAELIALKKCTEENSSTLVCANIEATISGSIRENGRVELYSKDDPCKPIKLYDEGLKWEQTEQVEASTYQILADAYRKSGVVQIGEENGVRKGLSGTRDGHTYAQTLVARRQEISFEDSKRNHAVNASSQTIGQLIAAEAKLDDQIVTNYNKGMAYLLSDSPAIVPGDSVDLDPIEILWDHTNGTDQVSDPSGTSGSLLSQQDPTSVAIGVYIDSTSNVRNGDYAIIKINGGEYYGQHTITRDEAVGNDQIIMTFPTVEYSAGAGSFRIYNIAMYVQDIYGNIGELTPGQVDEYQLTVEYQGS